MTSPSIRRTIDATTGAEHHHVIVVVGGVLVVATYCLSVRTTLALAVPFLLPLLSSGNHRAMTRGDRFAIDE